MLAIYCGRLDSMTNSAAISKTSSLKSKLASQIYRGFKKHTFDANQIYTQLYLLRPQWLSMMGVSAILSGISGTSLQNLASIKALGEKLYMKEIIFRDETGPELMNDSELHVACR